jgi:hypothetical protein
VLYESYALGEGLRAWRNRWLTQHGLQAPRAGPASTVRETLRAAATLRISGSGVRRERGSPHPSPPPLHPTPATPPPSSATYHSFFRTPNQFRRQTISYLLWGRGVDSFLSAMLQSASRLRPPVAACPVLNTFSLITAHGARLAAFREQSLLSLKWYSACKRTCTMNPLNS